MNPPTSDPPRSRLQSLRFPIAAFAVMGAGKVIGGSTPHEPLAALGIQLDLILFALVLLGIVLKDTIKMAARDIALAGLALVLAHQLYIGKDLIGHLVHDDWHETKSFANIFFLLLGFAVLAGNFKLSKLPDWLPQILPDDWKGGACILAFVLVISAGLDNIAAAMIGGVIASKVFAGRVTVGYLAAIVACSNAGGAGSVIGDTTTTMIWIDGVSPLDVAHGSLGAIGAALLVIPLAAKQQHRFQPIAKDAVGGLTAKDIHWRYLGSVLLALAGCIVANYTIGMPAVGVWLGLILGDLLIGWRKSAWNEVGHMLQDAVFITSLVAMASLMPVKELPAATAATTFGLGWLSSVFDNIPLTKLALTQGGYDWGLLAFAVGYGGSMTWFGSSAGVAISNSFPQAKNVQVWIREGWYVIVGYFAGFGLMMLVFGWHPHAPHRAPKAADAAPVSSLSLEH